MTVRAGAHYEAGGLQRMLLGSRYRDLWTAEVRVPVLSPDTFAGGLRPLQRGDGLQTTSLRFEGKDGRQYVFRSVDKDQGGGLPEDLRGTLVSRIAQDQVSSKHPGAALIVAPLLEAAGVLHVVPRLAVMADHPALEAYREEFAGMLGMMEERPEDRDDGGNFGEGRYARVIGTERLLERIEASVEDRADGRAYLAARLMDLLVGDWDRHDDQWRWVQVEGEHGRRWLPVPRDRDNAFSYVDGAVGVVGQAVRSNVVRYGAGYGSIEALTYNGQRVDRWVLSELDGEEWDAVAADLRSRLTDEVIANAVRTLPPAWYALSGPELERALRARRDGLPRAARTWYARFATEVDVRATDEADHARIERFPTGEVRVRLSAGEEGPVYFDRTFLPAETREVRVYLHGGPDRAVVTGEGPGAIVVRAIGGGGDDVLEDRSSGPRGAVVLHDDRGDNRFVRGPATRVDTRPYQAPAPDPIADNYPPPPREWGTSSRLFVPYAAWPSEIGPVVGGGPAFAAYGFRSFPHRSAFSLRAEAAPLHRRFGVRADARFVRTGSIGETRLSAAATNISFTRFHGYGNASPDSPAADDHRLWARELAASVTVERRLGRGFEGAVGPEVGAVDPEPYPLPEEAAADAHGFDAFGVAGMAAQLSLDRRDAAAYPTRGVHLVARGAAYPLVWGDAPEAFARFSGVGTAYLPLPFPLETTLALRAGGDHVLGEAPVQYAAFLGGGSSLRGERRQRYAGTSSAFANAEARMRLGRTHFGIARGELGMLVLADAGRVFHSADESDRWHRAFGGGLWAATLDRRLTGHVLFARGGRDHLGAGIGMPF